MGEYFWLGVFTAMNTLLLTGLAVNVSRVRLRERVAHGDGGLLPLKKAIRAHGNGVEHLVVGGLQVLTLELLGAPSIVLGLVVGVFTASRMLHAASMLGSFPRMRRLGAIGTYAIELAGGVAVVVCLL